MDHKAIKPDYIVSQLPTFNKPVETTDTEEKEKEQRLATLSDSAGWTTLKDYMEQVMKELDLISASSMAQGANFEEIGRNTVVSNLAKSVIQKIIDHVSDAREYRDRQAK